jgi:hypothetical protein
MRHAGSPFVNQGRVAMSVENPVEHFSALEDPQCAGTVDHRLVGILVIAAGAMHETTKILSWKESVKPASWSQKQGHNPSCITPAVILEDPARARQHPYGMVPSHRTPSQVGSD